MSPEQRTLIEEWLARVDRGELSAAVAEGELSAAVAEYWSQRYDSAEFHRGQAEARAARAEEQNAKLREALRQMLDEHHFHHYHGCPFDEEPNVACTCFIGPLHASVAALTVPDAVPEEGRKL